MIWFAISVALIGGSVFFALRHATRGRLQVESVLGRMTGYGYSSEAPGGDWRSEAPTELRGCRWVRRPSETSSGQWNPTAASRMHSGQIARSHRVQRTIASRSGCR